MSNTPKTQLIIEERPRSIGNFMVGRLLPFSKKRAVGPFVFIDHMGPVSLKSDENLDVAPHPHIGLSTLTYLFEGNIMHKDSLGTEIEIQPGQVNWMTAGKGIVHSERTPQRLRTTEKNLHGLQIWVALPKKLEDIEPSFFHASENDLPTWETEGVSFKLIAGEAFSKKSPVPVYSPLYFLELKNTTPKTIDIGKHLYGESALYILEGQIQQDGQSFGPKQLLVSSDAQLCEFEMKANTTVYIFGGEPFPEKRIMYWNFVSSNAQTIEDAKIKWQEQTFSKVSGETEFTPLPQEFNHLHVKDST